MGKLIRWNGDTSDVQPLNGTDYQLDELKKFVDGYIEIVNLSDGCIMVVNENGAFTKKPNKLATIAALMYHAIRPNEIIRAERFSVIKCKSWKK
jgi:hypothetical protein